MSYFERVALSYFKRLFLLSLIVGGAIAYDFMREGAELYNMPMAQAHTLLESAGLPDRVLGSEPKTFDLDAGDPRKIVWIVKDRGREAMRFAALLSPLDPGSTEVRVEVSGPTSGPFGDMQRRLSEYRMIRHLYVMAMKERVAATLEGREFSFVTLIPATTFATASYVVALAWQRQTGEESATTRDAARLDRERQNIERAYAR